MADNIMKVLTKGKYKNLKPEVLNLKDNELFFRDINNTSVGFNTGAVKTTIEFFATRFKLSDKQQFRKKFNESISGDGDELSKNNALHSSSLCALLCFYNIKNKPIEYKGIKYDDVFFEFKNKVIRNPSNMDVVLTGKDKEGKDSILFIECKFSEFFGTGAYPLGDGYKKEPYKHIFDSFDYEKQRVFQYGLKQLVAHYIGIRNFVNLDSKYISQMKKYYRTSEIDRINLYRKFDNVSFIEIIYDFAGEIDYEDYKKETELVFSALEKEAKNDNLGINLLGTTTYQEFFSGENSNSLDRLVKEFYNL